MQYKKAKLHANHIDTGTLMLNTRKWIEQKQFEL
jgi:hypothetical protein